MISEDEEVTSLLVYVNPGYITSSEKRDYTDRLMVLSLLQDYD